MELELWRRRRSYGPFHPITLFDVSNFTIPTSEALKKTYIEEMSKSSNHKKAFMMSLSGEILKSDHTFKVNFTFNLGR